MANQYNGRDGNGYQPVADGRPASPPGPESSYELKTPGDFKEVEQFGRNDDSVKKRPPTTEWPYGGPDLPKKRIVSQDAPVSVIIFVVAYSLSVVIGFALGAAYGS